MSEMERHRVQNNQTNLVSVVGMEMAMAMVMKTAMVIVMAMAMMVNAMA